MIPLAQQVMLNEMARFKAADARGKRRRAARQAKSIKGEPIGRKHVKDPWNDLHAYAGMRLVLCDSARETLRELGKNGKTVSH